MCTVPIIQRFQAADPLPYLVADAKLYTRANLNSGWVKAPDVGGQVIDFTTR